MFIQHLDEDGKLSDLTIIKLGIAILTSHTFHIEERSHL